MKQEYVPEANNLNMLKLEVASVSFEAKYQMEKVSCKKVSEK